MAHLRPLVFFSFWLLPATALANPAAGASLGWSGVQTIVALVGVCALAVGALRCLGPRLAGASGGQMRVVDRLALGGRQQLIVVCVEGQRLLLASTNDAVRLLTELQPDEAAGVSRETDGGV